MMQSTITKQALSVLSRLIKAARQQRKMSQSELATRIGTSRQTIIAIEKGNANVAIGTVLEAAHIVGVPILSSDKKQLTQWQAALANFESILPSKIKAPRRDLDDDF